MKYFLKLGRITAILLIPIILFSSCATIFNGSTDEVNFTSLPDYCKVYVDGQYMGSTPLKLRLESKKTHTVEFRKEGLETRVYQITNSVSGGYIVLDILFGFIPLLFDAATGNWYNLNQDHVHGVLDVQSK
jgi:hypothetical protein